ncbi:MAG: leucine-rich repeat domain-containing protein [Aureispira sp.]
MSDLTVLFKLLENANRKKIQTGLNLLQENPNWIPLAEERYLNFIQARLDNSNATIFDFEAAALTKEEVTLLTSKTYLDQYTLSLHYMEDQETKMVVDTIGSVFSLFENIEELKLVAQEWSEETFRTELPERLKAIERKIKLFHQTNTTYGWYGRIIKKVTKTKALSRFLLDHTSFESANDSSMMAYFSLGLIVMSRSVYTFSMDIAQSDYPDLTPVFWLFQHHCYISTLDVSIQLPPSLLTFVRTVNVREDDFAPYKEAYSQYIPIDFEEKWLEKQPLVRQILEEKGLTLQTFDTATNEIQQALLIRFIETTNWEVFKLGMSYMDARTDLSVFVENYYQKLLKALKLKIVYQLFQPISALLRGNKKNVLKDEEEEHRVFDVKVLNALPASLAQKMPYLSLDKNLVNRLTIPLAEFSKVSSLMMHTPKLKAKELPEGLAEFDALQEVQIIKAKLSDLPAFVSNWTALEMASFTGNQLTDLPKTIEAWEQLKVLQVGSNKFTAFPSVIEKFPLLEELDLSNNKLKSLPKSFDKLGNLKKLNLAKCTKIKDFSAIYTLPQLTHLRLDNTGISILSKELAQLPLLESLDLDGGTFNSIPKEIGILQRLKELHLYDCGLAELPAEIAQLKNLSLINLSANQFTDYATIFNQLTPTLKELRLFRSELQELAPEIAQLTGLFHLNLNFNALTTLPSEVGQLNHLEELWISENKLTALPTTIGQLSALSALHVMNNQLTALPLEIGQLVNLTELILEGNQLSRLPKEIGELASLEKLYLFNNKIEDLPDEIGQLSNLKKLHLKDNPIAKDKKKIKKIERLLPDCWVTTY